MPNILCLDIGGTNPRMAMIQDTGKLTILAKKKVTGPSLIDAMNEFLRECAESGWRTRTCVAAVAGPIDHVKNECSTPTHAKYPVIGKDIHEQTACKNVLVINDFEAIGKAVAFQEPSSFTPVIKNQSTDRGNRVVIGPGTGLGICFLTWENGYIVHGSEGGHQSIDVGDDELAKFTRKSHPKLTAETFLSGQGIMNITKYYLSFPPKTHNTDISQLKSEIKNSTDIPHAIAESHTKTGQRIMNDFMRILGIYAQDTALNYFAQGGIFLAGGILQKNKQHILNGTFSHSFQEIQIESSKKFLSKVPVYLIEDYDISFYGCARAGHARFRDKVV